MVMISLKNEKFLISSSHYSGPIVQCLKCLSAINWLGFVMSTHPFDLTFDGDLFCKFSSKYFWSCKRDLEYKKRDSSTQTHILTNFSLKLNRLTNRYMWHPLVSGLEQDPPCRSNIWNPLTLSSDIDQRFITYFMWRLSHVSCDAPTLIQLKRQSQHLNWLCVATAVGFSWLE